MLQDYAKLPITVVGAGSFGTALAILLSHTNNNIYLWGNSKQHIAELLATRKNQKYLPGIPLKENINPTTDLAYALTHSKVLVLAVPSNAFSATVKQIAALQPKLLGVVSATKGLEPKTFQLLSEVFASYCPDINFAQLSGPSFAKEVANNLPTAVSLACTDATFRESMVYLFSNQFFRVYPTEDLIGVQLGGALKNVIAIAAGISDALGFGVNARAALITRGLAELNRLAFTMGAKQDTMFGLAGMGDLVLTSTDNQSRNRRFGLALGEGKSIDDALKSVGQVVEGLHNVNQACALATKYDIEMPITEQINLIVQDKITPKQAVENLFAREIKLQ